MPRSVGGLLVIGALALLGCTSSPSDVQTGAPHDVPQDRATIAPEAERGPGDRAPLVTNVAGQPAGDDIASPPLRIAVAGDVGTGDVEERATADEMDRLEGADEYSALLMLGDNVYDNGDPSQLQRTVFEPFSGVLDGDTQLLPVLGNHDVDDGFGDAQADAIGMPASWYATQLSDEVLVIALESNRWDDPNQLDFLDTTLASATATWKIVIMHHPPHSGGWHGSDLNVRAAFTSLFEQYGVQLVLTGHDHDYQRSEEINGVTYVVSGGAAKLRPTELGDSMVVAESTYHFVDLSVYDDHLDLRAVDQSGNDIDSVTIET
jgi:3',5'-cyclic AMP phosphodiesterase CpdA